MTGRVEIPPLGMAEKIEIVFAPQTHFFAETCMFQLKVPNTYEDIQDFKSAFLAASANYKGFGAV